MEYSKHEIWDNGVHISEYPCDVNDDNEMESNGSIEHVIKYNSELYYIRTDWNGNII